MKHKDEKRVYCQYPTNVPAVLPSIQLFFINLWFRRLPVTLCHRSFFYQSSLPSPHSGQVKSCCLVTKSCPTLCNPMDYSPPGSFCPWDFLGKNTAVGCFFFSSRGSSQPRDWNLHLLQWQVGSSPLSPPGKHKWEVSESYCSQEQPRTSDRQEIVG